MEGNIYEKALVTGGLILILFSKLKTQTAKLSPQTATPAGIGIIGNKTLPIESITEVEFRINEVEETFQVAHDFNSLCLQIPGPLALLHYRSRAYN